MCNLLRFKCSSECITLTAVQGILRSKQAQINLAHKECILGKPFQPVEKDASHYY